MLARKSLLLAFAMLSTTGCIVADPPQYEEPQRTPPIFDLDHADPSPYWLVIVDRKDNLEPDNVFFHVPLRSDDQGEKVWFALHVDFKGDNITILQQQPKSPSTFDDTSRSISFEREIDSRVQAGCHQLTLIAAHETSWDFLSQQPSADAPKDDIAVATWWMNLDPPHSDPYTLPNCPNQSEVQK